MASVQAVSWSRARWLAVLLAGSSVWIYGSIEAFNFQRLRSGIVQQSVFLVRQSADVKRELGEDVQLKRRWPVSWIEGHVNQLKGRCEVRYKVEGRDGREGEALFKAVRRNNGSPWEVVDFRLLARSKEIEIREG